MNYRISIETVLLGQELVNYAEFWLETEEIAQQQYAVFANRLMIMGSLAAYRIALTPGDAPRWWQPLKTDAADEYWLREYEYNYRVGPVTHLTRFDPSLPLPPSLILAITDADQRP